ncbi:hypothetical protein [Brevibacillus sp. DP1.3A]|uniref:hypothetical protein n=1 Tax=Brevibacillus sp. DP1.3A TaxID=2738867 RepID=UPI00156AC096|nr:hypothetical protein [Brevibacillus sp. DP1.3A]UED78113.1 DUF3847 domain-containing protein [Brevibacillus sp. DP1.3A]
MARKSETERLQELDKKIEQLRSQKQQIEVRVKEKERKERTRRLIQIGAVFEKWWDVQTPEEAEWFLKRMEDQGLTPDKIKDGFQKKRRMQATVQETAAGDSQG